MTGAEIATVAIPQAGNMLGQLIANRGARKQQDKANEQNVAFWNMQNEYNHPSKQMARLREAGLNPALMYGGSAAGASGLAGNIAPSKAAEVKNVAQNLPMITYQDAKVKEAQTNNLLTQNTVLEQEKLLKAAQTAKLGIETSRTKFDYDLAVELRNTSLEASKAALQNMYKVGVGIDLDNSLKDKTQAYTVRRMYAESLWAQENLTGKKLENKMSEMKNELMLMGIDPGSPWYVKIIGQGLNWAKKNWEGSKIQRDIINNAKDFQTQNSAK
jgi:hypothetical protein